MDSDTLAEIISSKTRLHIADLLSRRPRSLRELSDQTGISMPGVIRHLDRLSKLGVIEEKPLRSSRTPVRKVYAMKGVRISDFSSGDLTVVKASESGGNVPMVKASVEVLESVADDELLLRRRIRDRVRRLGRMIDDLADDEARLLGAIDALELEDDERLILQTTYTEETRQDAERTLFKSQGFSDAGGSIERAVAKAKRQDTGKPAKRNRSD